MSTNYSTAIVLVNDKVKLVSCAYELDANGKPVSGKTYTFKTFDHTLKEGDLVVVPTETRVGFTVVQVCAVGVELDPYTTIQMKWIVTKVDKDAYTKMLAIEEEGIKVLKEAERAKARKDMMDKIEGLDALKAAVGGAIPVIEHKKD